MSILVEQSLCFEIRFGFLNILVSIIYAERKAAVVYRCAKFTNQMRENISGKQTKKGGKHTNYQGKQQNNKNTEVQQKPKR